MKNLYIFVSLFLDKFSTTFTSFSGFGRFLKAFLWFIHPRHEDCIYNSIMKKFNLFNQEGKQINRSKLNEVQAKTMQRLTALNYGYCPTIKPI